jgi:hypothetical protein
MTKRKLILLLPALTLGILCLSPGPAMGDLYGEVDVEWQSLYKGMTLQLASSKYGAIFYSMDAGVSVLDVGPLKTTGTVHTPTHALPSDSYLKEGSILAFCIDLHDNKPEGDAEAYEALSLDAAPDVFGAGGPMGTDKAKYIAALLDTYDYDTDAKAAAMQAAIWEILDEGSTGASAWEVSDTTGRGDFYLDTSLSDEAAIAATANNWLDAISKAASFSRYTAVKSPIELGKDEFQDFVAVPTPTAVLLGMLGLGAAGWRLRRFA